MKNIAISKNQTSILDSQTMLTRKETCEILHIALNSFDTLETYKSLRRIKIGRRTFVLKDDLYNFIMAHATGGNE